MTATKKTLTSAQRKTLKERGVDTAKVYVRRDPDAPKGAERQAVTEAYRRLLADEKELVERKSELVREFLQSDPEAASVVKELTELRTRKEVLDGRRFREAVEICRDGGWCIHVLAGGDTFNDAASKLRGDS